jgi:hypothetical protein
VEGAGDPDLRHPGATPRSREALANHATVAAARRGIHPEKSAAIYLIEV